MSTAQGILNGLLYLPDTEPMYRKAQMARQVLKDFNFSTSDGFEAEARKVLNMAQQWAAATDYTLAELGIDVWVQKAVVAVTSKAATTIRPLRHLINRKKHLPCTPYVGDFSYLCHIVL